MRWMEGEADVLEDEIPVKERELKTLSWILLNSSTSSFGSLSNLSLSDVTSNLAGAMTHSLGSGKATRVNSTPSSTSIQFPNNSSLNGFNMV